MTSLSCTEKGKWLQYIPVEHNYLCIIKRQQHSFWCYKYLLSYNLIHMEKCVYSKSPHCKPSATHIIQETYTFPFNTYAQTHQIGVNLLCSVLFPFNSYWVDTRPDWHQSICWVMDVVIYSRNSARGKILLCGCTNTIPAKGIPLELMTTGVSHPSS